MVKRSTKKSVSTKKKTIKTSKNSKKSKDLLLEKIKESELVPEAEILSEKELKELLEKLNITVEQLPKIYLKDPLVRIVGAKKGDVLKIKRKGFIEEEDIYYRLVI